MITDTDLMSSDPAQGEPLVHLPALFVIAVNPETIVVVIGEVTVQLLKIPIDLLVEFILAPIKAFELLRPFFGNNHGRTASPSSSASPISPEAEVGVLWIFVFF
jgi:hypothetical protein